MAEVGSITCPVVIDWKGLVADLRRTADAIEGGNAEKPVTLGSFSCSTPIDLIVRESLARIQSDSHDDLDDRIKRAVADALDANLGILETATTELICEPTPTVTINNFPGGFPSSLSAADIKRSIETVLDPACDFSTGQKKLRDLFDAL